MSIPDLDRRATLKPEKKFLEALKNIRRLTTNMNVSHQAPASDIYSHSSTRDGDGDGDSVGDGDGDWDTQNLMMVL